MKRLVKLVVSVAFAGFMQTVRSEWTCSDSTLVWSEDGVEYWKLAVAVEGMSITLTSLQSNPQASGVLDLTGALEAYGITGTGYSLAFVEGEGLSVFSSVTDLAITGSWFSEMATQAGAVFTALKSVDLGTAGTDIQLGGESTTVGVDYAVFRSGGTLKDISVIGRNVVLGSTFSGHRTVENVSVRAAGDLQVGLCAFYSSSSGSYNIKHAEFISGGDLTIKGSALRRALASGAQLYIEAPSSATVTLAASTFEDSSGTHPFALYWNAPCPNDAKNAFKDVSFDWFIYNSPGIVSTFPEMDGTTMKYIQPSASSKYTTLCLPSDSMATGTAGSWESTYGGSGSAYWHEGRPSISAGENGWRYIRESDGLVQTNAAGDVRWELDVKVKLNVVTLSPRSSTVPADKTFSLKGVEFGLPWSDCRLEFETGSGTFASVEELDLTGLDWLRQMNRQSAAAFTSVRLFKAGMEDVDIQLGDSDEGETDIDIAHSVFNARASLADVRISGRNVVLFNTFVGHPNVTNADVAASGALTVGPRSFYGARGSDGYGLRNASFVSRGNIVFATRSLNFAIAKDACVYVQAPATADVSCAYLMFQDGTGSKPVQTHPFRMYWNAPAPSVAEYAWSHIAFTWYVYNTPDIAATFQAQGDGKVLDGGFVTVSLPSSSKVRHTPGSWIYSGRNTYPAYWYSEVFSGISISFR